MWRSARLVFRRFWPLTKGNRGILLSGTLLLALVPVCEAGAVYLFGVITDRVLAKGNVSAFWLPALACLGLALVTAAANFGGDYLTVLAGERFVWRMRDHVFAHIQQLSPDFFDRGRLGDLLSRLTGDVTAIDELVSSGIVSVVTSVLAVVLFAGAAIWASWELALVALAIAPLFWLTTRGFTAKFHAAAVQERESSGSITSAVEESLSNQLLIQAYNRQWTEQRRLHEEGRFWLRARMAETRLSALYSPLVQVVETICVLSVLGFGAWEISQKSITIGGLLAFAGYLAYLYPPIQHLGGLQLSVAEATASADRVLEILNARPGIAEAAVPRIRSARRGRVAFDAVTFQYPEADQPTIDQLSFRAGPGDLVLLLGPSGAGKSTVTKLLLRFYDPTAGRIRLDGVDIRELALTTLRDNITLLQQETMLFPGSIADNIAYGRPGVTEQQVVAAAMAADAHEFILRLPQGYHTPIGQRGRLLSGGQRQRLAIARAIVRDTPVLVLDEPTTGLDDASAHRVLAPLRRLMSGRTTILITHDPHLVPDADHIVELRPTWAH